MAVFTPKKCVRTVLLLAFVSFIFVNINFLAPVKVADVTAAIGLETISARKTRTTNISGDLVNKAGEEAGPVPVIDKDPPKEPTKEKPQPEPDNVAEEKAAEQSSAQRFSQFNESLSFVINDINKKQTIRNVDKFPPNALNSTTYRHVLAIQVHNRDHYLRYLVDSLRTTHDINSSLLIVSHDFYSNEVFDIINSIDFMPVMQVFYPLAMQLYKNKYPGPDPEDCPRDMKKAQATEKGCINAAYPDKYGHYREAAYAQTKLHWFWKLHYIFDKLSIMKSFEGYVTLIEEDHYVTPDTLYMLNKMISAKSKLCAQCRIFTLGNYDKKPTYSFTSEVVVAPDFISSKHNMAMSLNRGTYELVKKHNKAFCDYDDYNWDWSLQYIGRESIPGRLPTMIVKTPRVYHIGDCGVHHKGKKCNPEEKVNPILDRISVNKAQMFPGELKLGKPTTNTYIAYKKLKANGGWGDKRDHDLCASFMDE